MEYFLISVSHLPKRSCLKAKVPLVPVSQSIVSKYDSNIIFFIWMESICLHGSVVCWSWGCVLTVYRSKSNIFQLWQVCFSVLIPASYPSFSSIVTGDENALDFPTFTWIEFSLQINNLIWYQFTFLSPISLALTGYYSLALLSSHILFPTRQPTDQTKTIFNIWVEYRWTLSALKVCAGVNSDSL